MSSTLLRSFGLIVLLLGLGTAPARGAGLAAKDGSGRASIGQAVLNVTALSRGKSAMAAVVLEVKPGFHAQSHTPSQDYLIPFKLAMDPNPVVTFGQPIYPKGEDHNYPALGVLNVYTSRVIAQVPIEVKADAPLGAIKLSGTVSYQICDDTQCYPPEDDAFTIEATIVPADQAVQAANQEVFGQAGPAAVPESGARRILRTVATWLYSIRWAFIGLLIAGFVYFVTQALQRASAAVAIVVGTLVAVALVVFSARGRGDANIYWVIYGMIVAGALFLVLRSFKFGKTAKAPTIAIIIALALTIPFFFLTQKLAYSPYTWIPYSAQALAEARATGKPVLVEFTADWCTNCHVLEATVINNANVVDEVKTASVQMIRGDVTDSNAPAKSLLDSLGGVGVPLTVIYSPASDTPRQLAGFYSADDLVSAMRQASQGTSSTSVAPKGPSYSFLQALGLAFLAGIVFNAVPCVLPVLPIKALGFYEVSQHNRARSIAYGLAFSLGILASFAVLGLLVVVLKVITWGQLFSNPIFSAILVIILVAMALNMFGLFTVGVPTGLYAISPRHDTYFGNFLFGILTAALSTPCTFGLFVTLLAWALTQPAIAGLAVIVTVGAGMAFPYVILSAVPEIARRFPRTGPWSEVVRQFMGFLLLAVGVFFAQGWMDRIAGALRT